MSKLANPTKTIEVLREHGIHLSKSFGQNFLVDPNILKIIIDEAYLTKKDTVLEIGSGIGTLTEALLEKAGKVYAVEVDSRFTEILKSNLEKIDNLEIIQGDVLKIDLKNIFKEKSFPNKLISNLPYNIATPLLIVLLQAIPEINYYLVMVQEELAKRYTASAGSKLYGAPTLKIQYFSRPKIIRKISPNVFLPKPKVNSALVRITRKKEKPLKPEQEKLFIQLVSLAFQRRRKQIGSLTFARTDLPDQSAFKKALEATGIKPKLRPENLKLEEYLAIVKHLTD